MILVSSFTIFACSIFNAVGMDIAAFSTFTNSAAAKIVLSSSEMDGTLQWEGKSLVVLAIRMPLVELMKNWPQR